MAKIEDFEDVNDVLVAIIAGDTALADRLQYVAEGTIFQSTVNESVEAAKKGVLKKYNNGFGMHWLQK